METINLVIADLIGSKNRTDKEIAADLGISPQRLGQYKNSKKKPGIEIIQAWKKVFGEDLLKLVEEKETKVSRGIEDNSKKNNPNNNQNGMATSKETWYTELIENEEGQYSLIPRAILKDYKIMPDKVMDVLIKANESEKVAIEKNQSLEKEILKNRYKELVEALEKKVKRLEEEKEELLRQITANKK